MSANTAAEFDYDVVLNPDDRLFLQHCVEYYDQFGRGFLSDTYKKTLATYKPGRYESIDGSFEVICLGKYFTIPSKRGLGIGQLLFEKAVNYPGYKDKNMALVSGPMSEKYSSKYGFSNYLKSAYLIHWREIKDLDLSKLVFEDRLKVVDFEEVDYKKVIEFDAVVTGNQRRDTFLKNWMTSDDMLASKVALDPAGNVTGFVGIADRRGRGIAVTPLFAVNPSTASTLLKLALEEVLPKIDQNGQLRTVVFESNTEAQELFDTLTDKKRFHVKLYGSFTKSVPDVKYDQVFATTELGINVV